MKVILYMAISINGFVAKSDHDTPWNDKEFESYSQKVKEIGNLIVGKTTFDLMNQENAFADLDEPFVVVLTSSKETPLRKKTIHVESFDEAVKVLDDKVFPIALVGGGGQADTAALESGRLEEIYIDIEPHVFGKGIPLFSPSEKNLELKLLDTKTIGKSGFHLLPLYKEME